MIQGSDGRKTILTGDRPTGNLHLGHYVGSLKNRVKLQEEYRTFILIADVQALTTHFEHPESLRENTLNVVASYLAAGIDPSKATLVRQSGIPEIHELFVYFSLFVTVNQLQQNPTIKNEMRLGYNKGHSLAFLSYPVHQSSDIAVFGAHLVPVGQDQVPHIEEARDIVAKMNAQYGTELVEPEALVGTAQALPGIDGQEKMSKSLGNAIFLCDEDKELRAKIQKTKTDPARLKIDDKGHPDVCTIFKYYEAFFPEETAGVRQKCENGAWGCGHCKALMNERLGAFIGPMRTRYKEARADEGRLWELVNQGTRAAREVAAQTLDHVRAKMHLR
jgi:tryptophanyl-tRNA synthetase